ncbi:hypothetical protein JYU34_012236 [Plutella xylostella]|uniref:Uncharacterized protein n=1 Tax=Plutella xylostella TaxID=51655 RepID=A0ABQ7QET0_PLUXY|nr:hypothetical protein JYU34_012236 [Plutella xylostella]
MRRRPPANTVTMYQECIDFKSSASIKLACAAAPPAAKARRRPRAAAMLSVAAARVCSAPAASSARHAHAQPPTHTPYHCQERVSSSSVVAVMRFIYIRNEQ